MRLPLRAKGHPCLVREQAGHVYVVDRTSGLQEDVLAPSGNRHAVIADGDTTNNIRHRQT